MMGEAATAHCAAGRRASGVYHQNRDESIILDSKHYGHTEDVHMTICHMHCYASMEKP